MHEFRVPRSSVAQFESKPSCDMFVHSRRRQRYRTSPLFRGQACSDARLQAPSQRLHDYTRAVQVVQCGRLDVGRVGDNAVVGIDGEYAPR